MASPAGQRPAEDSGASGPQEWQTTATRHHQDGWIVRQRTWTSGDNVIREVLSVQHESTADVALFLETTDRAKGLVVGVPSRAADVGARIAKALAATPRATAPDPVVGAFQDMLFMGAMHGDISKIVFAVEKGADLESKDRKGKTALFWACDNGHSAAAKALLDLGARTEQLQPQSRKTF